MDPKLRTLVKLFSVRRYSFAMAGAVLAILALSFSSLSLSIPTLEEGLQLAVGGALNGGVYAAAAVGLALVLGVTRVFNLAHGQFMVLASYLTYWAFQLWQIDPFLSIGITVPMLFVVGILIERVTISRVITLGIEKPIIITFAVLLIIESLMTLVWTSDVRALPAPTYNSSFIVGSTSIPLTRLAVFLLASASVIALDLFLTKTYTGKSLRAISQDMMMAETLGINSRGAYRLAFGIGSAFAGLAGSLVAVTYAFETSSGFAYFFKALAVVALAGMGNVRAVIVAGVLLGIMEVFGGFVLGSNVKDAFGYIVFLMILLMRPSGLGGRV